MLAQEALQQQKVGDACLGTGIIFNTSELITMEGNALDKLMSNN